MECLNAKTLERSHFFSKFSPSRPSFSFTNQCRRNPFKTHGFRPEFLLKVPISSSSPFTISARFNRTMRRRNSLRNKLIGEQKVNISDSFDPNFSFQSPIYTPDELESSESNMDSSNLEKSSSTSVEKSKLFGESVLWKKLENWVEQYRDDIEFWGIGFGPVFTVFKDLEGNVEGVIVNEDEILRRSRIEPPLFRKQKNGEKFLDVKSKISHAKSLAKEIEIGKYTLPKNCSVAKVVVSGKQSGFLNGIGSFIPPRDVLSKASRIGLVMLCGCLVVWSVKKILVGRNDEEEMSREEKEMLRRKMKRRSQDELERGSVEVIPYAVSPVMGSVERPQFNRQELMDDILKAKASEERLTLPDSRSSVDIESRDFESRVQEIKEMARRARELERKEREKSEVLNEGSSKLLVNAEIHGELDVHKFNDLSDGDTTKSIGINEFSVPPYIDDPRKVDTESFVERASVDAPENSDSEAPASTSLEGSESILSNMVNPNSNEISSVISPDTKENGQPFNASSDNNSSSSENLKPRIILSVKEAREYLSQKRDLEGPRKEAKLASGRDSGDVFGHVADEEESGRAGLKIQSEKEMHESSILDETLMKACEISTQNKIIPDDETLQSIPFSTNDSKILEKAHEMGDQNGGENGTSSFKETEEKIQSVDAFTDKSRYLNKSSNSLKPKVTSSVKKAREQPSKKRGQKEQGKKFKCTSPGESEDVFDPISNQEKNGKATQMANKENEVNGSSDEKQETKPVANTSENATSKKIGLDDDALHSIRFKVNDPKYNEKAYEMSGERTGTFQEKNDSNLSGDDAVPPTSQDSWIQKNYEEFEPIVKKIGDGFRGNYTVAKEKSQELLNLTSVINEMGTNDYGELDWMKDDSLREIVFHVRENELMGRDPFHMLDAKDKHAFFEGLEKRVEKENAKLLSLHEYFHSRIENLDYGSDGISLYDSPEKVIPRWKGPPVDKDPEFLNNNMKQQEAFLGKNVGDSLPVKPDEAQDTLQKSSESAVRDDTSTSSMVHKSKKTFQKGASKNPKTVIENSDGSSRVGKKSEKEYWQYTKKWSREFLEAYNAESDPEVKSVMKDIGKDLDRWITKKEVEEVGELMTKIPKRRRQFIEKKLDKLKNEMEMFGPQAVVSKYREYGDDKEEDYLWWLDLPFVLCIELYTNEDGVEKVGFYSLEMAADLELDPKQYHVIAFEDPGDSKNFCYIIQAQMEVLGNGRAFVVARPPKDAFREAKANGFSVTVIKKGELQLNVDQTMEEMEEQITEIGSKMYHDKIMRERSVDVRSVMKGVFGSTRPARRRRSKRMLRKPTKDQGKL